MFIEFVGLPGCGKTTISSAVTRNLVGSGFKMATIKDVAELMANKEIEKKRFLKRFKPRVWMYGAVYFAKEFPDVFDPLFDRARHDPRECMWLMNFFAHIHYAKLADLPDTYIILDEGFVHRGAATFLKDESLVGFKRYLDAISHSKLIISIELPVETAIERCRGRKSGIPRMYSGSSEAEVAEKFTDVSMLIRYAMAHQAKAGVHVVSVNGRDSVEECCQHICDAVKSL